MADFKVIVNAVKDYQVVPFDSSNPAGFQDAGGEGSREECDSFIKALGPKTKKVMVALGAAAVAYGAQKIAEQQQHEKEQEAKKH